MYFAVEADFNLIYELTVSEADYFPIYDLGFEYRYLPNFVLAVTTTHKHMNLDTFYQTSYASKLPFVSYGFRMNLDEIKLKPVKILTKA